MPETTQVIARNISVEVYAPIPEEIKINLEDYYDPGTAVFVSAAEGIICKATEIQVSNSGKTIRYVPNILSGIWSYPGISFDVFQYTLRDTETDETSTASITIRRIEREENFVADDIFITTDFPMPEIIQVNTEDFHVYDDLSLSGYEILNSSFIRNVENAPEDSAALVSTQNIQQQWDNPNDNTSFYYSVRRLSVNARAKARVFLSTNKADFFANPIVIDLEGNVPADIEIDVSEHHDFPFLTILNTHIIDTGSGTIEGILEDGDFNEEDYDSDDFFVNQVKKLKFTFDTGGYWDAPKARVRIRYTMTGGQGKLATSYIFINK